jgi:hypothetical protein
MSQMAVFIPGVPCMSSAHPSQAVEKVQNSSLFFTKKTTPATFDERVDKLR